MDDSYGGRARKGDGHARRESPVIPLTKNRNARARRLLSVTQLQSCGAGRRAA